MTKGTRYFQISLLAAWRRLPRAAIEESPDISRALVCRPFWGKGLPQPITLDRDIQTSFSNQYRCQVVVRPAHTPFTKGSVLSDHNRYSAKAQTPDQPISRAIRLASSMFFSA